MSKYHYIAFILFLFFFALEANADDLFSQLSGITLHSGEASFDGKQFILNGDVNIDHPIGKIRCHRITIEFSPINKGIPKTMKIENEGHIWFKDGSELFFDLGEIDYQELYRPLVEISHLDSARQSQIEPCVSERGSPSQIGKGDEEERFGKAVASPNGKFQLEAGIRANFFKKDVTYIKSLEKGLCEMSSEKMTLSFFALPDRSSTLSIDTMEAIDSVQMKYDDMLISADHASYQQSEGDAIVSVWSNQEASFCKMAFANGDQLIAKRAIFNVRTEQIDLVNPKGEISFTRNGMQTPVKIDYSADAMMIDKKRDTLRLNGNVEISKDQYYFKTSHEITIDSKIESGKKVLRTLFSKKNNEITFKNNDNVNKIYCPGNLYLNYENSELALEGENDKEQVFFENAAGEMFSNKVIVYFHIDKEKNFIKKVTLNGNIKIRNRFDGQQKEGGNVIHYAIANDAECFPEQKEMVLFGNDGSPVLLFDKINQIQMSAPMLKMTYDDDIKSYSIKGMGNVRFNFIEKELEKMKSYFSSPRISKK